jgi:hypothetical protein
MIMGNGEWRHHHSTSQLQATISLVLPNAEEKKL